MVKRHLTPFTGGGNGGAAWTQLFQSNPAPPAFSRLPPRQPTLAWSGFWNPVATRKPRMTAGGAKCRARSMSGGIRAVLR